MEYPYTPLYPPILYGGMEGWRQAGRQAGWDGGRHDDLGRRTDKCIAKSKHVFMPCLCVCTHTMYTLSTLPHPPHTQIQT
jgi:hypothetical protein